MPLQHASDSFAEVYASPDRKWINPDISWVQQPHPDLSVSRPQACSGFVPSRPPMGHEGCCREAVFSAGNMVSCSSGSCGKRYA